MSLYKRPGSKIWWFEITVNGERIRRSTGQEDKSKALIVQEEERQRASQTQKAVIARAIGNAAARALTLVGAAERLHALRWVDEVSGEQTLKRLRFMAEQFGNPYVADIDVKYIETVTLGLEKLGKGTSTVNRYLAHLRTLMRWCVYEQGIVDKMPPIHLKKEARRREFCLSEEQEKNLMWVLKSATQHAQYKQYLTFPEYADFYAVLIDTGMRLSEALALTFSANIDFKEETITVFADMAKSDRPRVIPMMPRVKSILMLRRNSGEDRVFPWTFDAMQNLWKRFVRPKTGIDHEGFVTHGLRHTCASRLARKGVDLHYISTLLGHSNLNITKKHYAHLNVTALRDVMLKSIDA